MIEILFESIENFFFLEKEKMLLTGFNSIFSISNNIFPKMLGSMVFQSFTCYYDVGFFVNPLPDDKILDWSNLKQIADDILKCI